MSPIVLAEFRQRVDAVDELGVTAPFLPPAGALRVGERFRRSVPVR